MIFGGKEGRVAIEFQADDGNLAAGLVYDPQESDDRLITIADDWQVLDDSIEFYLTVTKEKAIEIGAYLVQYQQFPKELDWNRNNEFNQYQ